LPSPERLFAIERGDPDEPALVEDDDSAQEGRRRPGVPPPCQLPGGGAIGARPGDGQRVPLRDERRQALHIVYQLYTQSHRCRRVTEDQGQSPARRRTSARTVAGGRFASILVNPSQSAASS